MTTLQVQEDLQLLGFRITMLDGIVGPETVQAIKDFQFTYGISVDGKVGPVTTQAISDAMDLLGQNRWNPSTDPVQYMGTATVPIDGGISPAVVQPGAITQQLAGIDWKWILAGIAAAFVIGSVAWSEKR